MTHTFIIAEAGSSHDNDLAKAYRLIEAAKECGADAVKFQWTSNAVKMADRRGLGLEAAAMYQKYLEKPLEWLQSLKVHADTVGIEFMCSTFLIEDIQAVAPLVSRFKVSAFESEWREFILAHPKDRSLFISRNPEKSVAARTAFVSVLHCVSRYPTPVEALGLYTIKRDDLQGLSDHTTSTLTGALAVAAGATIIEKHIRLSDTPDSNPDFPHSLQADTPGGGVHWDLPHFRDYVGMIREAERAL